MTQQLGELWPVCIGAIQKLIIWSAVSWLNLALHCTMAREDPARAQGR